MMQTPAGQFATFTLDHLTFGVDVLQIQEVIRHQELTPIPLAHPTVRGLMNLRGQIVTAIDMRRRCGLADRGAHERPMNVVVRTDDGLVSLLVDDIGEVVELDESRHEGVPETLPAGIKRLIGGVFKMPSALVLTLDVQRAIAVDEAGPLTESGR
jgi:purine-binding chemotaxis protein CheW